MALEITMNINPNELRNEIVSVLKKIYKDYSFLDLDDNFISDFVNNKINKNIDRIKDKNSFVKFVKKSFMKELVRIIKNNFDDDNKFIEIVNNYIEKFCKKAKNVNSSIELVNQLTSFLAILNYDFTPEKITLLINSSDQLNFALKTIVNKYKEKYKSVVENELAISFVDIYCMINNINFEEYEKLDLNGTIIDENADEYEEYFDDDDFKFDGVYCVDLVREIIAKSRQYQLLSLDEEISLIRRCKDGDAEAKTILYERNQRLVINIVKKNLNRGLSFMDLFQEGSIGLMTAIDRFNPDSGTKLSTYATWWIRQSMQRAIADSGRNIRLPVYKLERINRMISIENELSISLNREPTLEEVSQKMNMSVQALIQLKKDKLDTVSYNAKVDENEESELEIFLADSGISLYDDLERSDTKRVIKEILETNLTGKQRDIICMRFGLNGENKKTLEEIGAIYNITRERVRQIENKALRILRKPYVLRQFGLYAIGTEKINQTLLAQKKENIYDFFIGYTKREVDSIIAELTREEQMLITQKFRTDELHWTVKQDHEFQKVLHKIKVNLYEQYAKNNVVSTKNSENHRNKTIYEYFSNYSIEQIDLVISFFSKEEIEILRLKYGEDLKNPTYNNEWNTEYSVSFEKVKNSISKQLGQLSETIYSCFFNYPQNVVDEVIAKLDEDKKRLLQLRYGMDLKNPKPSILWKLTYEEELKKLKKDIEILLNEYIKNNAITLYDCFKEFSKAYVKIAIGNTLKSDGDKICFELDQILQDNLDSIEYNVISDRYGINHKPIKTYKELSVLYKRSVQQVKLVEYRALQKLLSPKVNILLKNYLKKYFEMFGYVGSKSIYSFFPEYSKEQIDAIILILQDNDKQALEYKYNLGIITLPDNFTIDNNYLNSRLSNIKYEIRNILIGKQIRSKNSYPKENEKKKITIKNFYSYFPDYSNEQIDSAFEKLSTEEQEIVNLKYDNNLNNMTNSIIWDNNYSKKFSGIIRKMRSILTGKSRSLKQKKELIIKKVEPSLYDYFSDYSKEELDSALQILSSDDRNIIYLRYGDDIEHPQKTDDFNSKKHSAKLQRVKKKIQGIMDDKRLELHRELVKQSIPKNRNLTIYEYFGEYEVQEVDKVINSLNYVEKEMLKMREGLDLEKSALISENFSFLLNKIKKNLEFNRKLSVSKELNLRYIDNPLLEKLLSSLSTVESKILEMKLGINSKKYTITEIAEYLNMSETEVVNSLKLSLIKYKEIFNIYIDYTLQVLKSNSEPDLELKLLLNKKSVEN